jgi:hypothetical protein
MRILFVRHEQWGKGSIENANAFANAIAKYRDRSSFKLLYISDTVSSQKQDGILFHHAPNGMDETAWDALIAAIHADEPIRFYFPRVAKLTHKTFGKRQTKIAASVRKRLIETLIYFDGFRAFQRQATQLRQPLSNRF